MSDKNINIHVIIEISLLNFEMTIKTLFRRTLILYWPSEALGRPRDKENCSCKYYNVTWKHCTNKPFKISIFFKGKKVLHTDGKLWAGHKFHVLLDYILCCCSFKWHFAPKTTEIVYNQNYIEYVICNDMMMSISLHKW